MAEPSPSRTGVWEWLDVTRVQRLRAVVAVVLVAAVVAAIGVVEHARAPEFDGSPIDASIHRWFHRDGLPRVTVSCPSTYRATPRSRFLCPVSGAGSFIYVLVTVRDRGGAVTWQLI